jgi:hypothetical protein
MRLIKAFWKSVPRSSRDGGYPAEGEVHPQVVTDAKKEEAIKEPPMVIDGRVMSADEFVRYVESLDFPDPLPNRLFLHHTWKPTRQDWRGRSTIMAMKAYYERQLWRDSQGRLHEGWTAGPHLFIADDGIWLFSDVRHDGVGVYGHNHRSRHIEIVGDYDQELPTGATLSNTVAALGILHERLGLDIRKMAFHRDFSSKSCPGWAVHKSWLIPQVEGWIEAYRRSRNAGLSAPRRAILNMVGDLLVSANPGAALAREGARRGLLGAVTREIPIEIDNHAYMVQVFAEALIVPVNEWDKVRSLQEYEASAEAAVGNGAGEPDDGRVSPPPSDPYAFQGDIR